MPKSPIFKNCIWAFLIGGLICVIGEALIDFYKMTGLEKEVYEYYKTKLERLNKVKES